MTSHVLLCGKLVMVLNLSCPAVSLQGEGRGGEEEIGIMIQVSTILVYVIKMWQD